MLLELCLAGWNYLDFSVPCKHLAGLSMVFTTSLGVWSWATDSFRSWTQCHIHHGIFAVPLPSLLQGWQKVLQILSSFKSQNHCWGWNPCATDTHIHTQHDDVSVNCPNQDLLCPLFLESAFSSQVKSSKVVALDRWGGKWNHLSMMHRLTSNYAKNYCNWTLIVKVIVENVVTCFFGDTVYVQRGAGLHFSEPNV